MVNVKKSMFKVQTIETSARTRTASDNSPYLTDMTFAEELILNPAALEQFQKLEVLVYGNKKNYPYVTIDRQSLATMGDEEGPYLSKAMTKLNQVFVALNEAGLDMQFPYRALSKATKDAPTELHKITKGKNKDAVKPFKMHDVVVIYKYGNSYDPTQYAIPGGRESKIDDKEQHYEVPTLGMNKRVTKWLKLYGYFGKDAALATAAALTPEEIEIESIKEYGFEYGFVVTEQALPA